MSTRGPSEDIGRRTNSIVLVVCIALLCAAAGFLGGRISAGESPLLVDGTVGTGQIPDFAGAPGGQAPAGGAGSEKVMNGSITSIEPGLMTINTAAGEVLVELSSESVVTRLVVSDRAELVVGDVVTVGADPSAQPTTGQVVAATIEAAPSEPAGSSP